MDLQLDRLEARQVLSFLTKGVAPVRYAHVVNCGREEWLRPIRQDLEQFIREGGHDIRFVTGRYGDGKTHFLHMVMQSALERNFACTFVTGEQIDLTKFETIYSGIVSNLHLPRLHHATTLQAMIDSWYDNHLAGRDTADQQDILRRFRGSGVNQQFAIAIVQYIQYRNQDSPDSPPEPPHPLMQWLMGQPVRLPVLRKYGLNSPITKSNSQAMLHSLVQFLRYRHYAGLVFLVDELDTILRLPPARRRIAYENLRQLVDNAEEMTNNLVVAAATPELLSGSDGFPSYDALYDRVRAVIKDSPLVNYYGVVVNLTRTPLRKEHYYEVASRIRAVHGLAFGWEPSERGLTDEYLQSVVDTYLGTNESGATRLLIKLIVEYLGSCLSGQPLPAATTSIRSDVLRIVREDAPPPDPSWVHQ